MNTLIDNYTTAYKLLMEAFNYPGDYYVKIITNGSWQIYEDDDICFLTMDGDTNGRTRAMIVKKDGEPMIFRAEGYTMVIALDCVKIAFVLNNENEAAKW
jgi:hypothetical protein